MAAEAQDGLDMESKIKSAMPSRISYFKDQADSLTFEGVRRVLEEDLGLETGALDSHKRFVKQCLQTFLEAANAEKASESRVDAVEKRISSVEGDAAESAEDLQPNKETKESSSADGETLEDSPVMGLMTGSKKSKTAPAVSEDTAKKVTPNEITIKKAIRKRASYLRENSQTISLAGVRRILEEDLKLEKHALDPFKKFINKQVDEVLSSPESPKTTSSDQKKRPKKDANSKAPTKSKKEEMSGSSELDEDEVEEDDVKPRKKTASKGKIQNLERVRKRKAAEEDRKGASKKQRKLSKSMAEEGSEAEDGGNVSEGDNSDSSEEKPAKKKEVPKPAYGKRVEHLRSIIKSCGMSISPAIYKKVKQAPEEKREALLVKELEDVLAKEGLSSDPSEKEIKEVKRRKEKAKELEGIDLSNIVTSSRRRSTSSFVPPPKPKIPDESGDGSEHTEEDEDEDEDDEEEDEQGEEVDEEQEEEGGASDGQSEESKGDDDDGSE